MELKTTMMLCKRQQFLLLLNLLSVYFNNHQYNLVWVGNNSQGWNLISTATSHQCSNRLMVVYHLANQWAHPTKLSHQCRNRLMAVYHLANQWAHPTKLRCSHTMPKCRLKSNRLKSYMKKRKKILWSKQWTTFQESRETVTEKTSSSKFIVS